MPAIGADDYINPDGLSYEAALAELLGMHGRWVKVTICNLRPLGPVAYLEGRLAATRNVRPESRADEGEVLRLSFDDSPSWVDIQPRMFSHAGYVAVGSDRGVLAITQGATVCYLDARELEDNAPA